MVKLYVLFDSNNKVRAHTRDEDVFKKYLTSLKKTKGLYPKIVKDKKVIKEIEDEYFKEVLWYDDEIDEVDTDSKKPLFDFAREEFDKLQILIKDFKNIIHNYNISKKDKKKLRESLLILKELKKKKNFKKAIGTDFISDLSKDNKNSDLLRIFNIKDRE